MDDKPAGEAGKKQDPQVENKPADHGPQGGVPEGLQGEEPKGRPTSQRIETETPGKKTASHVGDAALQVIGTAWCQTGGNAKPFTACLPADAIRPMPVPGRPRFCHPVWGC